VRLVSPRLVAVTAVAAGAVALVAVVNAVWSTPDEPPPASHAAGSSHRPAGDTATERLAAEYELVDVVRPARTQVRRRADQAMVATLTAGARTAVFAGPRRRFTEPSTTTAVVESTTWVRVAPQAWEYGHIPEALARWLLAELYRDDPPVDVLGAAMQYLPGVPELRDNRGVRYAGDAGFGYVHSRDERDGADFYDYLEIPWDFPDAGKVQPSARWDRDLDCSGYLRLIYGYRFGIPLLNQTATTTVDGLPRTAASMAAYARSVVIAAGRSPSLPPTDLSAIQPGDLVLFALHDDPALITHSGMYIGDDTDGGMRFVSSRGTVDGPTFGDVRGDGVIDSGYFAKRLRRVIRL
jgi:hypothetical protein